MPTAFLAVVGQLDLELGSAAAVFAEYAGARELAIGVALLVVLASRSTRALPGVMVVAALANGVDALIGVTAQRWPQVPGALLFALVYAVYAYVVTSRETHPNG